MSMTATFLNPVLDFFMEILIITHIVDYPFVSL